ncbi:conjugal transfer protein TraL [Enterovibrio calviensis]|uniref:conjugal transfer protein TraL n=1 Tax=Enterovibrio calviensis TaxID=91359 RepID=UPI0037359C5D
MHGLKRITIVFTLAIAIMISPFPVIKPAQAESDAACAIWLCLPTGFPSGCGDAKSEFKKRLKKFKPPLPLLTSCIVKSDVGGGSNMNSNEGYAARYPASTECVKRPANATGCIEWQTTPARTIEGESCHDRDDTCTDLKYVEVTIDGEITGSRFYY